MASGPPGRRVGRGVVIPASAGGNLRHYLDSLRRIRSLAPVVCHLSHDAEVVGHQPGEAPVGLVELHGRDAEVGQEGGRLLEVVGRAPPSERSHLDHFLPELGVGPFAKRGFDEPGGENVHPDLRSRRPGAQHAARSDP